ncbi:MAG: immunoglobulin-like domain-containing protein [Treponema sp.]
MKKAKDDSDPKDIGDVVEALKSQLSWAFSKVSEDINLLKEVQGFEHSTVTWKSLTPKYCSDAGKIKKDIVNVKVKLEATVMWQGNTQKVEFETTIERVKQIRYQYIQGSSTWDFSEENMLSYLRNDKIVAKFELKNVDVEKKQFVAQLKKRAKHDGSLVNAEDWMNKIVEDEIKVYEYMFGATYVKLRGQATITWEDIKAFVIGFPGSQFNAQTPDEKIFQELKASLFNEYQGNWDDFNKLTTEEKSQIIKGALERQKQFYINLFNIPKNTADNEMFKKIKETILLGEKAKVDFSCEPWLYGYKLEEVSSSNYPDNLKFEAKAMYDSKKEWYSQNGKYQHDGAQGKIYLSSMKIANQLKVRVETWQVMPLEFEDVCPISMTFTLKEKNGGSKTLNCTISNIQQSGKLTLSTTGGFTGSYEMNFNGNSIENIFRDF